jgi:hypothetical protein
MRIASAFLAVGVITILAPAAAQAQFSAPANSLVFDDSGTFEAMQGEVLRIRDSKNEPWLLKMVSESKVTIEGEADRDQLRPGTFVQFETEIDDDNAVTEGVAEIAITPTQAKTSLGLYNVPAADSEHEEEPRPVRAPAAGKYLIKGKIATLRDGEFLIMAGRHRITGSLAEDDLKVKLLSDDLGMVRQGDTVKVKAWYYPAGRPNVNLAKPGQAIVDQITVTLSKPYVAEGKKGRATPKSKVAK